MESKTSNTGGSTPNKGHFQKGSGKDPRINRKGRPRSFDALRELTRQIADEVAIDNKTKEPLVISDHIATVAEMILRSWAQSDNAQLQRAFIEIAYGKVPDELVLDLSKVSTDKVAELLSPALGKLGYRLIPPDSGGVQG